MARMLLTSFSSCKLVQMQLNSHAFQAIFNRTHIHSPYKYRICTANALCCRKLLIYAHLSINYLQFVCGTELFVHTMMYVIIHALYLFEYPPPLRKKTHKNQTLNYPIETDVNSLFQNFLDWYAY